MRTLRRIPDFPADCGPQIEIVDLERGAGRHGPLQPAADELVPSIRGEPRRGPERHDVLGANGLARLEVARRIERATARGDVRGLRRQTHFPAVPKSTL